MGDLAGVIPLDADAIVVVGRIADYPRANRKPGPGRYNRPFCDGHHIGRSRDSTCCLVEPHSLGRTRHDLDFGQQMDRALFHSRHPVHLLVGICPGVRHSRLSGHCRKIGRSFIRARGEDTSPGRLAVRAAHMGRHRRLDRHQRHGDPDELTLGRGVVFSPCR